jgi:hypothetical protein
VRRLAAAAALTALLATACGTTVPLNEQGSAQNGLGGGATGTSGGSTGAALGTSGTSTTGSPGLPGGTTGGAGSTATSGTGGVPGSTGATSGGVPTASSSGGVRRTDPVTIGFVTTSVGNASQFGINVGSSYPDQSMFEALVASYNSTGGLAGHKIVPVYGKTDTASTNWANQFNEVCAQFTQDKHVQAVIGYVFVFLQSFENCLKNAHVPHLYGGYQPGDLVDQSQYPTVVGTGHPSVDGALLTPLVGALKTGLINAKTKLGVLVNTCADGDRAYARTAEPWLKAHKVAYQTVSLACAQGSGDVSGAASAVSSAELKFAASGVNLVYSSDVALLVFMEDAESQGYRPEYLTNVGGAGLEANAPQAQMQHLHGFGWMPAVDVNPSHQPYPRTPAQTTCVNRLLKAGLKPSGYNDFMAAYQACDGLELYAAALRAGASSAEQVASTVASTMGSFAGAGAGTYAGALRYLGKQHGGPAQYRAYAWTDSCKCMTYRGPTYPVPTP